MVNLVRDLILAIAATAGMVAVMSAVVTPSAAQDVPPKTLRQACAADVEKLCSGIMPGGGRIQKCFVEKQDQVSAGCKDAMKEARALRNSVNGMAK